ncbi:TIGR01906 family membrane protein [Jeotgalibaca caeni]|uniref:TIGR01906 family membrane protein n=1 Tax=Jeotgalibaca caeni TaxID=3028623 RepID=UPI00237DC21B|nr:TIGR01906 family membrane protein [Jeotgalibaca caeni]MDE1549183.1 TIGR01906 family membrane protein [Jeotgalibaca caeni]
MMQKIKNVFGSLAIFLFILTAAIAITINFTPLYSFDITYLDIEGLTGLSKEVIMENYQILMRYLNVPWVGELNMPDFPSSASGLFHFYEVKRLFMFNYGVMIITGIISFFFLRNRKRSGELWQILNITRLMVFIPIFILFFIALNFNQLFVTFHQIFFNNDAWIFDWRTDPIILALPQEFFMHCFILVFVLLEAGLWALYFWTKRQLSNKKRG